MTHVAVPGLFSFPYRPRKIVLRMWMVGCFLLPLACSDRDLRSASLPVHTDTLGIADEARPMLMFRCESGRVGAYLVAASGADDSDFLPDDAVRVDLDSAPPCIASAP